MEGMKVLIDELKITLDSNKLFPLYFVVTSWIQKDVKESRKEELSKLKDEEKPKWEKYFTDEKYKDASVQEVIKDYLESFYDERGKLDLLISCKYWLQIVMYESAASLPNINKQTGIEFAMKSPLSLWLNDFAISLNCICLIVTGLETKTDNLCVIRNMQLISKFKTFIEPHIVKYCEGIKKNKK